MTDFTTAPDGRTADGILAGGTAAMIHGVRNLHALGASFEEAVLAATAIPARIIDEPGVGQLTVGGPADVVGLIALYQVAN